MNTDKDLETELNDEIGDAIRESVKSELPLPDPNLRGAVQAALKPDLLNLEPKEPRNRKSIVRSRMLWVAISCAAVVAVGFFLAKGNEDLASILGMRSSSDVVAAANHDRDSSANAEVAADRTKFPYHYGELTEPVEVVIAETGLPTFEDAPPSEPAAEWSQRVGDTDITSLQRTAEAIDAQSARSRSNSNDLAGTGVASRTIEIDQFASPVKQYAELTREERELLEAIRQKNKVGTDESRMPTAEEKSRMVKEMGGWSRQEELVLEKQKAIESARRAKEAFQQDWNESPNGIGAEQYEPIHENPFIAPAGENALSTFSIDVDTASYSNMRRFLTGGRLPPPNAVRIEELINYFSYDYPQPKNNDPFSVNMEVAACPWNPGNRLLRIGLKGKEIDQQERPISNLVFLLDVSGSMQSEDKLPLLKRGMKMLVDQLGENDTVSIVTYASGTGVKLQPTNGTDKTTIMRAIDELSAGGSTHGSAGINLAYQQAEMNFLEEGTNRVILATDGDLNVGITQDDQLVKLIKEKASRNIFLTVLGFGTGNLKDAKMEKLADNGNGMYAYIDSVREARKVLVQQMSGSLVTIAKDVKLQLEFNPAQVKAYRLIGYENRVLAARDFDDDKKDAGEIGAGHTVTALYEIVPTGAAAAQSNKNQPAQKLKYQQQVDVKVVEPETELSEAADSGEMLTLSLRFKQPNADKSRKIEFTVSDEGTEFGNASEDFRFAASVASFGMLLRNSSHRGSATFSAVEEAAARSMGSDTGGYRAEFLDLVRRASQLK